MEEANNHFSARASNIAVTDGLLARRELALAGRERHLETTLPNPRQNSGNERHASANWKRGLQLGVPMRPDSEKLPPPGKGRQMHPHAYPKMAQRHHPTTSA
ncbi:hypothetical protein TcYC6_0052050 [Trypanosoma cruzi]|nr:hypothetical protein TcYC6_0052050 [Trypanosoma cruzi]